MASCSDTTATTGALEKNEGPDIHGFLAPGIVGHLEEHRLPVVLLELEGDTLGLAGHALGKPQDDAPLAGPGLVADELVLWAAGPAAPAVGNLDLHVLVAALAKRDPVHGEHLYPEHWRHDDLEAARERPGLPAHSSLHNGADRHDAEACALDGSRRGLDRLFRTGSEGEDPFRAADDYDFIFVYPNYFYLSEFFKKRQGRKNSCNFLKYCIYYLDTSLRSAITDYKLQIAD